MPKSKPVVVSVWPSNKMLTVGKLRAFLDNPAFGIDDGTPIAIHDGDGAYCAMSVLLDEAYIDMVTTYESGATRNHTQESVAVVIKL